ncbi:hypothetical protein EOL94_00135 [bacterium]|nr:hypothetical protein [bacterium]
MKKIAILLSMIFVVICTFAQTETTTSTSETTITETTATVTDIEENFFQNLYVGSLNTTMFNSSGYTATSSLRVGAAKDFALGKKLNLRLAGTYDNGLGCTINQASLDFDIKNVKI